MVCTFFSVYKVERLPLNLYLIVTLCPRDLLAVLKNLCAWPPPLSAAAAVAAVVAAQVEVGQRVEADIVRQVKAGKIEPPFSHSKRSWSCGEPKLFSARKFRSERPPTFFGSKLQPVFFVLVSNDLQNVQMIKN